MTFPESDRVVHEVDTLGQVVCQLTFPPILAIGAEPPAEFQERIRENYPLYERQDSPRVPPEIAQLLASLPVKPPEAVVHQFSTEDHKRTITLSAESIAVTETEYEEWPVLQPELERAKTAVEEIYGPAFYSRIGLRYQDVLDRESIGLESRSWKELLNPAVSGMLGADDDNVRNAVVDIAANVSVQLDSVDGGRARIQHGLGTPQGDSKVVYLIDADYFTESRKERGEVLEILVAFNHEAGNFFRWATSSTLRDALGRRDVGDGGRARTVA